MKILTLRNAIVETIKVKEPAFNTVEPHGGSFDVEELRRIITMTPSALLALLSIRPVEQNAGAVWATIQWALYVVTGEDIVDGTYVSRDVGAVTLVNNVLQFLPLQKWGVDTDLPKNIAVANLFSGTLDEHGAAIFQITWDQRIQLDFEIDPLLLPPYQIQANGFVLDGDPLPKVTDETELPQ